jgi:hypothetical protein
MERCVISPPISRDHRDQQIKLSPKHGVNPERGSDYGQTTEGAGIAAPNRCSDAKAPGKGPTAGWKRRHQRVGECCAFRAHSRRIIFFQMWSG